MRSILSSVRPRFLVVGRAETAEQAAELAGSLRADVVLADQNLTQGMGRLLPAAVSVVFVSPRLGDDADLLTTVLALTSAKPVAAERGRRSLGSGS